MEYQRSRPASNPAQRPSPTRYSRRSRENRQMVGAREKSGGSGLRGGRAGGQTSSRPICDEVAERLA
eukprot:1023387-Prymnesium_polylepis.1